MMTIIFLCIVLSEQQLTHFKTFFLLVAGTGFQSNKYPANLHG